MLNKPKIIQALQRARETEPIICPLCGDDLYAPMEKLCVALYGKCIIHIEMDSPESDNLLTISEQI